jgi:hypothetical protein
MALVSPGVQVTVIDESFYTPAEPGTTPLIVVATAQNKTNASGTAVASGTLKENAGKAFRMTSQKDIIDFFGVPFFEKTATGSPIHGGERNEYGLLAAYSLLGVTNSAFIVRADVDLDQLAPQSFAPGSQPDDGQWWINTGTTAWGIKEWNGASKEVRGGQTFINKTPLVLTDDDPLKIENSPFVGHGRSPKESVGSIGDYAVVYEASNADPTARIFYKSAGGPSGSGVVAGQWVLLGSEEWSYSWPFVIGSAVDPSLNNGDTFLINGTTITIPSSGNLSGLVTVINNTVGAQGVRARVINGKLYLYTSGDTMAEDSSTGNQVIIGTGTGTPLTAIGITPGTYYGPRLQQSPHTQVPQFKITPTFTGSPTGSVWINTTEPNSGARWRVFKYNSALQSFEPVDAPIYNFSHEALFFLDRSGGGLNIPVDAIYVHANSEEDDNSLTDDKIGTATYKVYRRSRTGSTVIKSPSISTGSLTTTGTNSFRIWESVRGQRTLSSAVTVSFTVNSNDGDATRLATAINAAGFTHIEAEVTDDNEVEIYHKVGGDFRLEDITGAVIGTLFSNSANFYDLPALAAGEFLASNWQPLSVVGFAASRNIPINEPDNGQLWYNPEFSQVDIMIHNGNTWVGYRTATSPYSQSPTPQNISRDGYTPIVSASNPYTATTLTGDLWISTADLENFPTIYRYDADLAGVPAANRWVLIDKTDQVTEDGILFADARYGSSGATGTTAAPIFELANSNYLDPDAPDPALYPRGMLLWNTRRSGGNVKRYADNYIDTTRDNLRFDEVNSPSGNAFVEGESMENYATDRWVTASPNNEDGSGSFGRKAQRGVVVRALKSVTDTSQEIRDTERRNFNIIAAPGYPELLSNLINLNLDRGLLAFVVGDTPLRLRDDATSLINWGTNARLVLDNGDDGIVSFDEYAAVYYPNGFTTDLGGSNAVVPASHMMLRTITLSDQASYPWFAPAGTRRGGITNATAVGYIDSLTGEFQTVALNEGQRDVLYDLKVNPIPFFVGVGLVAYGQKTRGRNASALDRINVARLVVYLRSQLNKLARPYIFEPNDKLTRDEVKQAVESLLLELVGLRAIFDFAVVCDESNNTPSRIDRNELWVDIAIEPVKAVEFIYIPLRVKNTGEI